jgi:hypothetical protein
MTHHLFKRLLLALLPLSVGLGILFSGWERTATLATSDSADTPSSTRTQFQTIESAKNPTPLWGQPPVASMTEFASVTAVVRTAGARLLEPLQRGSRCIDEDRYFQCTLNWSSFIAIPQSEKAKALIWVSHPRSPTEKNTATKPHSISLPQDRFFGQEEQRQGSRQEMGEENTVANAVCSTNDRNGPNALQLATLEVFHHTPVVRFFGDSTLREVVQTLLRFVGNGKGLEKKDANATFRAPYLFRGSFPGNWPQLGKAGVRKFIGSSSTYTFTFRFDSELSQLLEPLPLPRDSRGGASTPTIEVVSLGVHLAHHQLVDLNNTLEVALRSIPEFVDEPLDRYLQVKFGTSSLAAAGDMSKANAGTAAAQPSPSAKVYFLLQELECDQMVRAKVKEFNKKAKRCPDMQRFLEVFNARLLSKVLTWRQSGRFGSSNVFVLNPLGCLELRPLGRSCSSHQSACACSKDGIHLRSRYLRAKVEGMLFAMQQGLHLGRQGSGHGCNLGGSRSQQRAIS